MRGALFVRPPAIGHTGGPLTIPTGPADNLFTQNDVVAGQWFRLREGRPLPGAILVEEIAHTRLDVGVRAYRSAPRCALPSASVSACVDTHTPSRRKSMSVSIPVSRSSPTGRYLAGLSAYGTTKRNVHGPP